MPVQANDWSPGFFSLWKSVATGTPVWSSSVAVTSDRVLSRYDSLGRSTGVTTAGTSFTCCTAGGGSGAPTVPVALCAVGAAIVHVYCWFGLAELESHVQLTAVPVPEPLATTVPASSRTVTVHGAEAESRAVKWIDPPKAPLATGS